VAAVSATAIFIDPGFLVYVPKYVLGGLLFFAGGGLFYRWLINSARQLQVLDYLSLIAIALIILKWGFIAGVLIGVIIGCATFALSASRVSPVKFSFDGSEYRSSLDRSPAELSLLTVHGSELQGIALQSYLFFGSTSQLYDQVKGLLAGRPECRFLLFDFHLVTGIDSSATHNFEQIKQAANAIGARLVLVNLTPDLQQVFHTNRFDTDGVMVATDLDHAMESCEQAIIEAHVPKNYGGQSLVAWLTDALGSAEYANDLAKRCKRLEVQPGDDIARQGEPSDSMHFILEGRAGIYLKDAGRMVRVRSLGPHTMIGEMGLITGRPRSATIRAELASVLYLLPLDAYHHMVRENPALGQAMLKMVIEAMSERLSFANRAISALRR